MTEILYDSPEAAHYTTKTLKGWWSRNGRFCQENEHFARYDGCTHVRCEKCGSAVEKSRTKCPACRKYDAHQRWLEMDAVEWNGSTPICIHDSDTYFFSEDDLADFCHEEECKPSDLDLVCCEPIYLSEINEDHWCDEVTEEYELPQNVYEAIQHLNNELRNTGAVSWRPGRLRIRT